MGLNVKCKTIKLPEDNIGENIITGAEGGGMDK
jgi:hypothetical protein